MQPLYRERISMKNPAHFCAVGFGSGLIPFMPGTFGSLAALPLLLAADLLNAWQFATVTTIICLAGIYICGKTAEDMQVHDHGSIVWDEVAGMFVTFLLIPISLPNLAVGFVIFRFYDILKPWPIGMVDKRLHGGIGIMLDDVLAGLMACLTLQLFNMNWPLSLPA
ncbi:phosphatidylglycerophosphatase A [Alteromonas pelagimontana]|uniref:Phosphatidylglycerophosphatase A n=1 Tax=Alteromonas pelagimontana TaxID=1858656 RepID=A0A6M4MGN9_9ALTE|nr:phosphatidylglycerophosphatase A [Alteromonas pelagimontana]QJR82117.1 phosphatidylglycerophosphatase A [Alteromonas pelagimontana]